MSHAVSLLLVAIGTGLIAAGVRAAAHWDMLDVTALLAIVVGLGLLVVGLGRMRTGNRSTD